MNYGEGDIQRAFFGFHNEEQFNNYLIGLGVSSVYSAIRWYRNNHAEIKLTYDLLQQLQKKKMARRFGRKRNYRRRGYKRRRISGRRRYGRAKLSRRIRSISRMLRSKGIRSTEIKYVDSNGGGTVTRLQSSNVADLKFTKDIAQGNAYNQRVGGKIFVRKIRMYIMFTASSTSTYPEQYVKWLVVREKTAITAGAVPDIGQVISAPVTSPATQGGGNQTIMTSKYVNNRFQNRFQVLWSGLTKVVNESGSGEKTRLFKKTIKVFKPTEYGINPDGTDLGPGQIYLYMWSSDPTTASANQVSYQYFYRVSFTDV